MTNIFIFNNSSRAANYGIGTYVRQLSVCLSAQPDVKVSLVEMQADTKEFSISDDGNGVRHYLIPQILSGIENETYCRTIFYFLARSIGAGKDDMVLFQFNYFQHYPLALLLKSWYKNSRILLTVHYMEWCFELRGNVGRMREITAEGHIPSDDMERAVAQSFAAEMMFLHLADRVMVLSENTKRILASDYKVPVDKMQLVYNGIGEHVYGNGANNKIGDRKILFVGRLDEIKGLRYLIEAFALIAEKHKEASLVIVGDGDFQPYMVQGRKLTGRIAFVGKMAQSEVEGVYQTAYIGVMPSFHEQCSYTAIEMMRHGIPVVGTDSTGLGEMLDPTPDLRVHINESDFNDDEFISQIAIRLDMLLSDDSAYRRASSAVLRQYNEKYTSSAMAEGVRASLRGVMENSISLLPYDYLPHLDTRMVGLINSHPDIDLDFYGLTGIGVYLWWRVLQLERGTAAEAGQLAFIKEHLIYYMDWVCEVAETDDNIPPCLAAMLLSMREHSFYPTKVDTTLLYVGTAIREARFPSEHEILHNALRICTCKI